MSILDWISLGYFAGCSISPVFWEIDFYSSADQVSNSLEKQVFDMLCSALVPNSVGHQEFWPISSEGQPQTLTLVNCFLLIWFTVKSK